MSLRQRSEIRVWQREAPQDCLVACVVIWYATGVCFRSL